MRSCLRAFGASRQAWSGHRTFGAVAVAVAWRSAVPGQRRRQGPLDGGSALPRCRRAGGAPPAFVRGFRSTTAAMETVRDPYKSLGVSRDADDDEIKKAYRKMARKYHPDVNKAAGAKEKFLEISQAYDMLKTSQRRAQHRMGMGGMGDMGGMGGYGHQQGFGQGGFGGGGFHAENVSFQQMMDDMKRMFEEQFGDFGQRSPDAPQSDAVLRQLGEDIPDTFLIYNEMLPSLLQDGDDFFLGVESDAGPLGTMRGVVTQRRIDGGPAAMELKEVKWVIQTVGWTCELLRATVTDDPEGKKSTLLIKSGVTGKEWGRMVTRSRFLGPLFTQHDLYNERGTHVLTGYRSCFLGTRVTLNYAEGHRKAGKEAALFRRKFLSFGSKYQVATNTSAAQLHPGVYLMAASYWHWLDLGSSPLRGLLASASRWLGATVKRMEQNSKDR